MKDQEDFVIRPVVASDLDWLLELAHHSGPGFTSLPDNKDYVANRLDLVLQSFAEKIPPQKRIYLFLRENILSKERIGISGIQSNVGYDEIFYSYLVSTEVQAERELGIVVNHKILNLLNNFQNASQLISFLIHPKFRGKGWGQELSLSRLLFIAQHPDLFGEDIVAELRGVSDTNGYSPFWDALGKHFFCMDFSRADALTDVIGKHYIYDLMPRFPIYVALLPKTAQDVIGMENTQTKSARKYLENEGFKYNNYIDIFDAGPLLNAKTDDIHSVANSQLKVIAECKENIGSSIDALIATTSINMHTTAGKIAFNDHNELIISNETAKILNVSPGDSLRYSEIK